MDLTKRWQLIDFNRIKRAVATKDLSTVINSRYFPWLMWGLGAAFFFLEYSARVGPSVMANDLMASFHVNALALGSLSAFFYYSYILMQIPVGMLMDRFGPQRLLTVTALICAIGAYLFAYSMNVSVASIGRLLMGFGAAFAFVGSLKLAYVWFPSTRFGLMAGLTQAIGMLGAATGEGIMSVVVSNLGWRNSMISMGFIFLILAVAIGLVVRDYPASYPAHKIDADRNGGLLASLYKVLSNPRSWINATYAGFVYAPTAAFAELWGVNYLRHVYHIDLKVAATAVSLIFIGWAVGGPITGWVSDKIGRRRPIMIASAATGLVLLTIILYAHLPLPLLFVALFLYGATNTGVAISYAVASEINSRQVAGTSMAFANMASVLIGTLFQPIIGWFLVMRWDGQMLNGAPIYSLMAYKTAMIALPICLGLGLITAFFVKETHCRSVNVD